MDKSSQAGSRGLTQSQDQGECAVRVLLDSQTREAGNEDIDPAPQAVSSFTMRPRLSHGTTSGLHGTTGRMRITKDPQPPQPGKSRSDELYLQPLSIFVIGKMVQMV